MKGKSVLSCRGCMTQVKEGDFYSLRYKKIKDLFVDCTSIEILPDDTERLPRQLCSKCFSNCQQWHTFKNMCKEVNEKLHNDIQECVSGQNQEHLAISIKEEVMETDCASNIEVESFVIVGKVFREEEEEADQEKKTEHEGEQIPVRDMTLSRSPPRDDLKEQNSDKNLECFVIVERISSSPVANSSVMSLHMDDKKEDQPGISKETLKLAECPVCKEETDQLLKHLTTVHLKPGQKECPVCMKTFVHLRAHLVVHTDERPFPCGICEVHFNDRSCRLRHWKDKHQDKTSFWKNTKRAVIQPRKVVVECPVCHKSTLGLSQLHVHFVAHTDEKPYRCNYCNFINGYKRYVNEHIRSHHPNESVEKGVSIKEESIFKNNRPWEAMGYFDIKRLTQEEAKNLPSYICKTCGRACRSPSSLIEHSVVHTGERPFHCVYCPADFTAKSAGIRHVSKYHPQKPLKVVLKIGTNYAKELAKLRQRVSVDSTRSGNDSTKKTNRARNQKGRGKDMWRDV